MIVIGLMSGTSADGVDAAVVEAAPGSPPSFKLLSHVLLPHADSLREEILACVRPEHGAVDRICALNFDLGEAFAQAALAGARAAGIPPDQIDLIGSHGQTMWHIPGHSTLQIASPAVIAERTGATVISNMRARDMAAGGQGAPLVPYVDALLLRHPTLIRAAQNIGGVANVTYLPPLDESRPETDGQSRSDVASRREPEDRVFAFDNGPGNMLIDDAARRASGGALQYDADGALAAQGKVDGGLLEELMDHPFLRARPPKTTGREVFGAQFGAALWERGHARGLRDVDVVATTTAFTALSIAVSYRDFLPEMPNEVLVSGGGALNPTLMRMLEDQLNHFAPAGRRVRVMPSDAAGIPILAKEAFAFAILAFETWRGQPSNLPAATGARAPVILGDITPGVRFPFDRLTQASA